MGIQPEAISREILLHDFASVLETFARLASRAGIAVTPFGAEGPHHFRKLPFELQGTVFAAFERYVRVCEEAGAEGNAITEDSQILWRMFRELGVHPLPDLMTQLDAGDVIEIYNNDYVQVFRNARFFSLCSYTLDELLSRPFWELFRREESVTGHIIDIGSKLFQGEIKGTHEWNMGAHTVEEVDSPALYRTELENKILSPLFDAYGRPVAAVNVIRTVSSKRMRA